MRTLCAIGIGALVASAGSARAVQNEIFGLQPLSGVNFHILRYDVGANSFHDCGMAAGGYTTNLAMDANRRLYYMNPNDGAHAIWQADLDGSNNLINQQVLDTLNPGLGVIDGFTIGPDQNLYMTGYGQSRIYRYNIGSNNQTANTEVTLQNGGPGGTGGEFRSDLAFDPLTGYLVGIGIVPGSTRRSLFQIPGAMATNGVNDTYAWEYYGGNTSPWSTIDLNNFLGLNPDGVAFDPTTGQLYLSGDDGDFSLWNRTAATLVNYIPIGGPDTRMGVDLAFQQTVPVPGVLGLVAAGGVAMMGWRRRR